MKAITVRQPWAWAIAREVIPCAPPPKRWENRSWLKSPGLIGQARAQVGKRIALHAGLGCTHVEYAEAIGWMIGAGLVESPGPRFSALPRGAIVATAVLAELAFTLPNGCRIDHPSPANPRCHLCGEVLRASQRCPKADLWAIPSSLGLALDEVEVLAKPVPFKGAYGLFEVGDVLGTETR